MIRGSYYEGAKKIARGKQEGLYISISILMIKMLKPITEVLGPKSGNRPRTYYPLIACSGTGAPFWDFAKYLKEQNPKYFVFIGRGCFWFRS